MIAPLLLAVTLHMSPAKPTVGDVITLRPPAGASIVDVRLNAPMEVVGKSGSEVTVRSFAPGAQPILLAVASGGRTTWERTELPIASVLRANDDAAPAPMTPPIERPENVSARRALSIAGALALLSWAAVYLLKRRVADAARVTTPRDRLQEFLRALHEAEHLHGAAAAVRLADAVRAYLPVRHSRFTDDLTTGEVLQNARSAGLDEQQMTMVRRVLEAGDFAKFSPWRFEGPTVPVEDVRLLATAAEDVAA